MTACKEATRHILQMTALEVRKSAIFAKTVQAFCGRVIVALFSYAQVFSREVYGGVAITPRYFKVLSNPTISLIAF